MQAIEKRREHKDRPVDWHIAMRDGKRMAKNGIEERLEHLKAKVRAIVEHSFRVIKCQFG